ncbi:MAG: hypothetical protein D6773_07760, partial [Alphaproteobacteria bacterium]
MPNLLKPVLKPLRSAARAYPDEIRTPRRRYTRVESDDGVRWVDSEGNQLRPENLEVGPGVVDAAMRRGLPTALDYGGQKYSLVGTADRPLWKNDAGEILEESDLYELNDLDMSPDAREQRMFDMGFDDQRFYHGSPRDIEEFDPSLYGTEGAALGKHTYLTTSADDASVNYATPEGPDLQARIREDFETIDPADLPEGVDIHQAARDAYGIENEGAVYPLRTRGEYFSIDPKAPSKIGPEDFDDLRAALDEAAEVYGVPELRDIDIEDLTYVDGNVHG